MANEEFHKSSDGIPKHKENYPNEKQDNDSGMSEGMGSNYIRNLLMVISIILVTSLLFSIFLEFRKQNTCTRFLNYQTNYAEYLVEVERFVALAEIGELTSQKDLVPAEAALFSSKAALAIELSDPFGVEREAARLNEHMRVFFRQRLYEVKDIRPWVQAAIGLRDSFATAVQSSNPCNRSLF